MSVCGKCIHKNVCGFCKEMGFENVVRANDFNCKDYLPTTADVAEVKHGEWIVDGNITECSNCHKEYVTARGMLQLKNFDYCPNCGAKMNTQ